jgi:hypothetical protein
MDGVEVMTARSLGVEERNAKRREKYHNDVAIRKKYRDRARAWYTRNSSRSEILRYNCIENLSRMDTIGTQRDITYPGGKKEQGALTFSSEELGVLLGGYAKVTITLWQTKEPQRMPKPVVRARTHNGIGYGVYTKEEATALLKIFSMHQEVTHMYRSENTRLRETIFNAIDAVRGGKNE